jgi:hypothetical protein
MPNTELFRDLRLRCQNVTDAKNLRLANALIGQGLGPGLAKFAKA